MPVYDCGDEDCEECKRAFGPDRRNAIEKYKRREAAYAAHEAKQPASHKVLKLNFASKSTEPNKGNQRHD